MRKYHIIFEVPDDFVPEELDLNASYKDDITIECEGFYEKRDLSEVEMRALETIIKEQLSISKLDIKDDSIVIFQFPSSLANYPEEIQQSMSILEKETGRPAIGLIDDINLMVQNSDEAIQMLEGMISKIKTRSAILAK